MNVFRQHNNSHVHNVVVIAIKTCPHRPLMLVLKQQRHPGAWYGCRPIERMHTTISFTISPTSVVILQPTHTSSASLPSTINTHWLYLASCSDGPNRCTCNTLWRMVKAKQSDTSPSGQMRRHAQVISPSPCSVLACCLAHVRLVAVGRGGARVRIVGTSEQSGSCS